MENNVDNLIVHNSISVNRIRMPLLLRWQPKEDITVFELARCIPLLFGSCCVYDIPKEGYMRHFEMEDPNK